MGAQAGLARLFTAIGGLGTGRGEPAKRAGSSMDAPFASGRVLAAAPTIPLWRPGPAGYNLRRRDEVAWEAFLR